VSWQLLKGAAPELARPVLKADPRPSAGKARRLLNSLPGTSPPERPFPVLRHVPIERRSKGGPATLGVSKSPAEPRGQQGRFFDAGTKAILQRASMSGWTQRRGAR